MQFYYNNISYKCKWKSLMDKNMWYSMEPVRLKVQMKYEDYVDILYDIKNDTTNKTLRDILKFKVLGKISEFPNNGDNVDEIVLLTIESYLDRISILSKVRDNITVQFDVSIYDKKMGDKSDIRDILIDQLV